MDITASRRGKLGSEPRRQKLYKHGSDILNSHWKARVGAPPERDPVAQSDAHGAGHFPFTDCRSAPARAFLVAPERPWEAIKRYSLGEGRYLPHTIYWRP